jgi:hypothetical protein
MINTGLQDGAESVVATKPLKRLRSRWAILTGLKADVNERFRD